MQLKKHVKMELVSLQSPVAASEMGMPLRVAISMGFPFFSLK